MKQSINKNVKFYLMSNSLYYGGFDIIGAFLAILIVDNITGGSVEIVGYLLAYGMILRAVLEMLISPHTKSLSWNSKEKFVTFGYILYGIVIAFMGFSTTIYQIFIFQTLISLIDALCYPLKWSIFTSIIDRDNQEVEWGLEDITSTFLSALFAALAGFIINSYDIRLLFVFFGTSYFLSGFLFHFIKLKRIREIRRSSG